MKLRLPRWLRSTNLFALSALILLRATIAPAESLPLERAIRLALSHSTTTAIASADVQRAVASYRELRNHFIPQLVLGSGLGYSYGFPLSIDGSAPALGTIVAQSSVYNPAQHHGTRTITQLVLGSGLGYSYGFPLSIDGSAPALGTIVAQSSVYNPAQSQYLNAAKAEIHASELQDKDQRNAVIQDVAVSYAELAKWEARLTRLQQDEAQAQQLEKAVSDRGHEGVDSATDLNKAKLVAARVRLRHAEARGSADVLRRHLADLTGLPVSRIELAPESIPVLPPLRAEEDLEVQATATSPTIKIAEQHALAESMRASAEHREPYLAIDFSAQYARLSSINNYNVYYGKNFQPDNAIIGIGIRVPLFNASQRARAQAA